MISISPEAYGLLMKLTFPVVIIASTGVVVNAIISAKEMGGTLGQGLKKIASGTIIHTILFLTYMALEKGMRGILTDEQIKFFFMITGILGSTLLCAGFYQIYKISRRLKLFTI